MKSTRLLVTLGIIAGLLFPATYTHAAADCSTSAEVGLVLALDKSTSVSLEESALQQMGYVKAFRHADVISRILRNRCGIAATMMVWSDGLSQTQVVPWMRLHDAPSIERFAVAIEQVSIESQSSTSIAAAVRFGIALFDLLPVRVDRKVIDVSGDGIDDEAESDDEMSFKDNPFRFGSASAWASEEEWQTPFSLIEARAEAERRGITINGLAIYDKVEGNVVGFYHKYVKTRSGFVIDARSFGDFEDAVRSKLLLELS